MSDGRVLVVGTTPDYIAYIQAHYPGRALFLTDYSVRENSKEARPDRASEIVCNLLEGENVFSLLHDHLEEFRQNLTGVTCYDCEWLSLAAELAVHFKLPFPSIESVLLSRDKFLTKKRWAEHGVRCPRVELVNTGYQALQLIEKFNRPVVLKPLTGSGSELTFLCNEKNDLSLAYPAIKIGLAQRSRLPLYKLNSTEKNRRAPDYPVLAEEFVEGREYSADFIIDNDNLILIRVAKKLGDENLPFGTTTAYVTPVRLPGWLNDDMLREKLHRAAKALGFIRAICMVDFMISKNEVVFLELTPRIGGDCLPPLIRQSCGLDTIGLALDFAEGQKREIPPVHRWTEHVGLRLFAPQSGVLSGVNFEDLADDPRVKEIYIKHSPGHAITLPPEDYDSWLLGHIIFESEAGMSLQMRCRDIKERISINVEQYHAQKLA